MLPAKIRRLAHPPMFQKIEEKKVVVVDRITLMENKYDGGVGIRVKGKMSYRLKPWSIILFHHYDKTFQHGCC